MRAPHKQFTVVYSLGDVVSNNDGKIDIAAVSSISQQFERLLSTAPKMGMRMVAVVGAGGLGRKSSSFAKNQVKRQIDSDRIAIDASRLNALLLASAIYKKGILANLIIPETWSEFDHYLVSKKYECIILGGIDPRITSDSTAAKLARKYKAALVIVSTHSAILGKGRKILDRVDRTYLRKTISSRPKENVLDRETCKILLESKSGLKAILTGYSKIFEATRALLAFRNGNHLIEGATRILV